MIDIRDPGPLTTVQDLGRVGQLRYGIPQSGALDRFALIAANRLVGNRDDAAGLECTLLGPAFAADQPCAIAVTGAEASVTVNGLEVPRWATVMLDAGDVVKIGTARAGLRSYVGFSGGIDVPLLMGSRSTYVRGAFGGYDGRALRRGDRLRLFDALPAAPWGLARNLIPSYAPEPVLRVVLGPQDNRFTAVGIANLLGSVYRLSPQSDRMGARLQGTRIEHTQGHDIISDGTALGSIQVPGDGQPIVLLVDRQSTGGYTKIATVCSFEIGRIGQLRPGQPVRFAAVSIDEAHRLSRGADAMLARINGKGSP
jgi:biotin-dependent carboxylase-like uncharacterized protein